MIVDEAIRLAPKYDLQRGNEHIWQALRNLGIRRKDDQVRWFSEVKQEIDRELFLREEGKRLRQQEHEARVLAEAIEHEHEIDPEAHDRPDYQQVA